MKHPKTKTIFTALSLGLMLFVNAQGKTKGKIVSPGPKMPNVTVAVGYGSTMPSGASKDAYLVNATGVNADVSIPFASFRKGWDGSIKGGKYVSLIISGQYNFGGSGNPTAALPSGFAISGQTSSSVAYKGGDPRQLGFRMGLGPHVKFNLDDKFSIAPMVLFEYFSMTQKELSAVQTTQYNGQTLQYNLWTLPETKTSGLAITPKIRVQYMITQSLGLFADASYILGPKVQTQLSTLVPEGNPNQEGQYNQLQLDNGTVVKGETKSTSYTALGVNVGLSFAFGYKNDWPNKSTVRKGWDGSIKGKVKLTSPSNGEEVSGSPTFRWTPVVPRPKDPITYKLKVWQLMQGQNPSQAMKSNTPLLEKSVVDITEFTATNLVTGPCKPPYMCDFFWDIQAIDASGNELNNSDPTAFSIRKGWDGSIKGGVKIGNSGGVPETASDGTTIYVVTFSNGCKRACSEPWTILSNGCACPGEQTNMSCPANLTPNSTATARINTKNIVYDKDGNSVVTPTSSEKK